MQNVVPWWQHYKGRRDSTYGVTWAIDLDRSQLAHELLTLTPNRFSQGLEVTNLTKTIQDNEMDARLITRARSRQVLDAVSNTILTRDGIIRYVLLLGCPSIGKSRNLLYLLKNCMGANQLILYKDCATNSVYAFVPLEQILNRRVDPAHPHELDSSTQDPYRYTAFRASVAGDPSDWDFDHRFKCAAMWSTDTVYLHDTSCLHPYEPFPGNCRIVISTRYDRRFYKYYMKHNGSGIISFQLNPCTLDEALAFYELKSNAMPRPYDSESTHLSAEQI